MESLKNDANLYRKIEEETFNTVVKAQQLIERWENVVSPINVPNLETRLSCAAGAFGALAELAVTKTGTKLDAIASGCLAGVFNVPR